MDTHSGDEKQGARVVHCAEDHKRVRIGLRDDVRKRVQQDHKRVRGCGLNQGLGYVRICPCPSLTGVAPGDGVDPVRNKHCCKQRCAEGHKESRTAQFVENDLGAFRWIHVAGASNYNDG